MKLNCGPTWQERQAAKEKWHSWFAWYPVRIGSGDCRWLEFVERKGTWHHTYADSYWTWRYREKVLDKRD